MTRLSATARKAANTRQAGAGLSTSSLRSLQGEGMPGETVRQTGQFFVGVRKLCAFLLFCFCAPCVEDEKNDVSAGWSIVSPHPACVAAGVTPPKSASSFRYS